MFSQEILLSVPVRTAIGNYNGSLRQTPAVELATTVIKEVIKRSALTPEAIDTVVMGNVIQAGNKMNPARQATIHAGLSVNTPALTVNRVCGSGAQAIVSAAQEIAVSGADIAIAGGMENMDLAPYLVGGGRWGYRMGDAQIYDSMLRDGLHDAFSNKHSGWHTEDLIMKYSISREEQDAWALRSHHQFTQAQSEGKFVAEIAPITIPTKGGTVDFEEDETNRPDTSLEKLTKLKPAFRENGTLTAGNSPGLNSGAAAILVSNRAAAKKYGLEPLAKLMGYAVSAVEPGMFGIAPAPAIQTLLKRVGWTLDDVERFEINEAYAAVPLAVIKELGLNASLVNIEGGAVAHGHPIGATGAILTTRLLHSMQRDGLKRGIVALCIGGGQGIALALEAI
ncbi:thiolase family protein [Legionella steelei]|uniref:thiolase family protein n=1 Tax=Legionella steelei TaxID=947033 RepID=UPI001ACC6CDB|nr:thiolase family protein [Legionella steelei]MBN9227834.1 thiolase family protein [Legionella steelei]